MHRAHSSRARSLNLSVYHVRYEQEARLGGRAGEDARPGDALGDAILVEQARPGVPVALDLVVHDDEREPVRVDGLDQPARRAHASAADVEHSHAMQIGLLAREIAVERMER